MLLDLIAKMPSALIILVAEVFFMRITFAGTPSFAAEALSALIHAGHDIALVLTQPDRPSGRGMRLKASPVKEIALEHGIKVISPETLSIRKAPAEATQALSLLQSVKADVLVVAAYGLILPEKALTAARGIGQNRFLSAVNIHPSLLPRWRGAAPIQRAIEAGDTETGISIMKMEKGLDTGPVLLAKSIPITPSDTAASLTQKLTDLGAQAIVQALENADTLVATAQDDTKATYARKILKTESDIDWNQSVACLDRRCRAFFPFPGLRTTAHGEIFKIWAMRPFEGKGIPGQVLCAKKRLVVACADGAVECLRLQKSGKAVMDTSAFLQSFPLQQGEVLK